MAISRALDSNNDLQLVNGRINIVEDGAEVVQSVRTRLQFYLGEWYLDRLKGVPWFQEILGKHSDIGNIESLIKQEITETPGFSTLTDFAMKFSDNSLRRLTLGFSAETIYGQIDSEKVTINV